jgi:hypothetical protein
MKKFTVSFCTTNGLLMVDCSGIRDSIIPKLDTIFRQLTKMIAKDLLGMTKDFSSEMNKLMMVCYSAWGAFHLRCDQRILPNSGLACLQFPSLMSKLSLLAPSLPLSNGLLSFNHLSCF